MRSTTDPHPVRWMRDVEVLLWTTSSGKRLRLGGGRRRVGFHGWSGEVMAAWDFEWRKGGDGRGKHDLGMHLSKM